MPQFHLSVNGTEHEITAAADTPLLYLLRNGLRSEGGAIQATSWNLKEQVRFDRTRITSSGWDDYPILRFSELPAVEVELLERPQAPSLGAGEAAQGPAAIANAVFDALGERVRSLPITPERIVAAAD